MARATSVGFRELPAKRFIQSKCINNLIC